MHVWMCLMLVYDKLRAYMHKHSSSSVSGFIFLFIESGLWWFSHLPSWQHDALDAPSTAEEPGPELLWGWGQGTNTARCCREKCLLIPVFGPFFLLLHNTHELCKDKDKQKKTKPFPSFYSYIFCCTLKVSLLMLAILCPIPVLLF